MGNLQIVGERIKTLRQEHGKTQRDVCDAIHIEQVTLSQYENGKRIPKLDILILLAQYYGVTLDYLVGISELNKKTPYPSSALTLTNEEKIMIDSFQKLDLDNKYIIIGKTKELLKEQLYDQQEEHIPLKKVK